MEAGVIAAIVILSVELIIIIVVLAFLFSGRCPPKFCKKDPSPESGQYKNKVVETNEKNLPDKENEEKAPKTGEIPTPISDIQRNETENTAAEISSSDEGVGDLQKTPSNAESSSSNSECDENKQAHNATISSKVSEYSNSVNLDDAKNVVEDDLESKAESVPSSATAVSIDDGVTLSLRLQNPVAENAQNSSSSSSSSSSDSEDEHEIKVFRTFDELPPEGEQEQEISIIYDPTRHNISSSNDTDSIDSGGTCENQNEVVAGIINVTSGEKLTICQAISKGLIPKNTGMLLLEAQAATGSVVNPRTGVKLSVDEALRQGIVDYKYKSLITASEGAYYGYLDPHTNESVPLFEAMKRGIFLREQGIRLLEAQMATGGIIDPWTGRSYPLSKAVKKGLIDHNTSKILTSPEDHAEFFDPNTKERFSYGNLLSKCIQDLNTGLKFLYLEEKPSTNYSNHRHDLIAFRSAFKRTVTLGDLMKSGLVSQRIIDQLNMGAMTKSQLYEKVKPYLMGEPPIAGIFNRTNHEVLSICQAVHHGLLRRGTALELLEAQAATGYIIDPKSGKQMSVNRAVSIGLVERRLAPALRKAEHAVLGYQSDKHQNLSLFEAIKRGLVIEIQGIRLLDAQIATGGIIDPVGGYRIPLDVAVKRGILDHQLANKLANPSNDQKGYYDPNTDDNVSYGELMRRSVVDKKRHIGMRLLPLTKKTPNVRVVSKAPTKANKIIVMNTHMTRQKSLPKY